MERVKEMSIVMFSSKKDEVTYFPNNVLATKDNEKAHELIKGYLWNT